MRKFVFAFYFLVTLYLSKSMSTGDRVGKVRKRVNSKMSKQTEEHEISDSDSNSGDTGPKVKSEPSPKKSYALRKDVKVEEQRVGEQSFTHTESKVETFPTTLKGFGYHFTQDGKLRHLETGEPFVFEVRPGDSRYNQAHYEALGDTLTEHVYEMLEKRCGLIRHSIPIDHTSEEATSFFFHSPDAFMNTEKLLVLIHGSGAVRAGQWARRLIINDSINSGTQIPFIEKGVKEGFGVIVMNTNENRVKVGSKMSVVRESSTPEAHGQYVWQHFILSSPAKHISIIAHSYGGIVTSHLLSKFATDFHRRVFAIAFTDSVHSSHDFNKENLKWIKKHACNWVTSTEPLDTALGSSFFRASDVPRVSAGHTKHEMTSWSSFSSIFSYLGREYVRVVGTAPSGDGDKKRQEL